MLNRFRTFDALSDKNYARLWLGQVGSSMGQWMDLTATGWLVYSMTHSPLHLGLVTATKGIPALFFGLIAGVVADKYSRKIQLVIASLTDAIFAFLLATLVITGRIELWHIYTAAFLSGTAQAFQSPARAALVHDLVGTGRLLNSVALLSVGFNVSRGIGPMVAGILVATPFGVSASYYAQFIIGIATAIWTMQIRVPKEAREAMYKLAKDQTSFYRNTVEGLRYVASNRMIRSLMILGLAPMVLAMPFTSLFPLFAVDILDVGATGQGLLLSCLGVGAITGGLFVASMKGGPVGKFMLIGAFVFGVSLVLFSRSEWMWFSMAMTFAAGAANTSFTTQDQTVVQMMAPDHMRGRILSIYMTNRALQPLGMALAGVLAHYFGGPNGVLIMGLDTIALVVCLGLLVPEIYRLGSSGSSLSPAHPT